MINASLALISFQLRINAGQTEWQHHQLRANHGNLQHARLQHKARSLNLVHYTPKPCRIFSVDEKIHFELAVISVSIWKILENFIRLSYSIFKQFYNCYIISSFEIRFKKGFSDFVFGSDFFETNYMYPVGLLFNLLLFQFFLLI